MRVDLLRPITTGSNQVVDKRQPPPRWKIENHHSVSKGWGVSAILDLRSQGRPQKFE